MSGKRGKYSPEFRDAAVHEVIDKSRPVAEVARENGFCFTYNDPPGENTSIQASPAAFPQYVDASNSHGMNSPQAVAASSCCGYAPQCKQKWQKQTSELVDRVEIFMSIYAFEGATGTVTQSIGSQHTIGVGLSKGTGPFKIHGSMVEWKNK